MKHLPLAAIFVSAAAGAAFVDGHSPAIAPRDARFATCTGDDPCNACKNCKYCKHCEGSETCSICK